MSANLCIYSTADDRTVCDADEELTGVPFEGDCPDCTYAFSIDTRILRDDGNGCAFDEQQTLVRGPDTIDVVLAFTDEFVLELYDYERAFPDALLLGRTWRDEDDSGGYVVRGPSFDVIGWADDQGREVFERTGDAFTWSLEYSGSHYAYASRSFSEYCYEDVDYSSASPSTSDHVLEGSLPEHPWYSDAWEFDTAPGQVVTVSADGVSAATADCFQLLVNTNDGCTVENGWCDVPCDFPGDQPNITCPAIQFVASGDPYEVWVSNGGCGSTDAMYGLRIDADGAPLDAVQTIDDVEDEYMEAHPHSTRVVMRGRFAP